ncbi:MAG: DUF423 domain-containing protein [Acetobacteraceae bacterium]|nr:DUF423 domain-containing protein [Acetobacteraceae bacterium]
MERLWVGLGALAGLSAVAMAALTAHGLEAIGPARLHMARSAVQMQGWHALALVACGLWARRGGALADWAGAAFTLGLLVFCGAVYALALGGLRVGALAPVGGVLLMLGWLLLALSALRAA